MQRNRKLYLDICDYTKTPVCNIYDNQSDISGQATNVVIHTERNGWKEISFDIPSTCMGENGEERNYRLDYLIAEYRIRVVDDYGTDWYIISEPKITHNAFSKNVSVTAGHVSQLLKYKNLDLEFSDTEGNNVGTAENILACILEGSGWEPGYVYPFVEDDNATLKVRSISGSAGTGAYSFIQQLCEVFEAKPVFDGDAQTVSLYLMNPFAKYDASQILPSLDSEKVIELYYDRNIHNIQKVNNTDSMATRMYAYGSSGDKNGACTLQNAEHNEYYFKATTTGNEYHFTDNYGADYFFKGDVAVNNVLIYSDMDITSRTYIWNNTKNKAYQLYKEPEGSYVTLTRTSVSAVKNQFPYLLGLKYYMDVGLMTDAQFQQVAAFQRNIPQLYITAQTNGENYVESEYELSTVAESNTGFLKLGVRSWGTESGTTKITINTNTGDHGVIYRTDYDVAERRYFQWHVAKELKPNGDPVTGTPSVVYIVHNTSPITWERSYLKKIYDKNGALVTDSLGEPGSFEYSAGNYPSAITLWNTVTHADGDRIYLFCTDSMSGDLGRKLLADESAIETLDGVTREASEEHPTYFGTTNPSSSLISNFVNYAWYYKYYKNLTTVGDLYFCWKQKGNNEWHRAYVDYNVPSSGVTDGDYYFSLRYKVLYVRSNSSWVKFETTAEQRVANKFSQVMYYCRKRDMLRQGLYDYYTYNASSLPVGNYAIKCNYLFYWTFTTKKTITGTIKVDVAKTRVWQDEQESNVVSCTVLPYDTVFYPTSNELTNTSFSKGKIDASTGADTDDKTWYRCTTIKVWENTKYVYSLSANCTCFFYDINLRWLGSSNGVLSLTGSSAATGNFTTPATTKYIRIISKSIPTSSQYIRVDEYSTKFYYNDKPYKILSASGSTGTLKGIDPLMKQFADLADITYETYLTNMRNAQQSIKDQENSLTVSLGDMLKDGRWQDSNYVKGDEKRLYDDAMYIFKQVCVPETTYSFTYLSMFGVHNEHYYEEHDVKWPDITMEFVAHLVDTEINTNCWAYIDKIDKWYDQEWKTTIEIDTKLTLASDHSFTDVIARIAEVAKETKLKRSQYENLISGSIATERLEGAIALNQVYLNGGASSYYTDANGNFIFEAADGLSAMIVGGRGIGVSTTKDAAGNWVWRTAATGYGLTADTIYSGYLSADRIEATSISADKLMANVGQELEISSNKALALFATEDGTRPAGTLKTTDAMIEILAGSGQVPAKINIASGGELDLTGASINITSTNTKHGQINISSASELNLASSSTLNISGQSALNISSAGTMTVASDGVFALKANGGNSVSHTAAGGIYLGSDGINVGGGKFKVTLNGNTSTVYMDAKNINLGGFSTNVTLWKKFDDTTTAISDLDDELTQEIENNLNSSIVETVRVYRTSSSNTTSPAPEPGVVGFNSNWTEDVKAVDSTKKYLWSRNRYKTYDGKYTYGTAVVETELGGRKIEETHREYMRTANASPAPTASDSGWSATLVASAVDSDGLETKPYVWGCTYIKYTNGESERINITSEKGLESMSRAAVTGTRLATGKISVPKVDVTGIQIANESIKIGASSVVEVYGNAAVKIGSSSSNSAIIMNTDGMTLGSGANIGIVSGGTITIGNAGKLFTIGSNQTNAYIRCGPTSIGAATDGIYMGTDGIYIRGTTGTGSSAVTNFFKATSDGKVELTGKITAQSGSIGSWTIGSNYLYSGSSSGRVALGTSGDYRIWAGNETASSAPFSVKSDGSFKATKGTIGGWTIGSNYFGDADTRANSTIGVSKVTSDTSFVFWAGGIPDSGPNFSVTKGGKLTAKGAAISGNSTFSGSLSAATGTFAGSLSAATGTFEGTLSAACVTSGTMSAARIKGGTLTLGGASNGNGSLKIVDADNNTIGTWGNAGISITKGSLNIGDGNFKVTTAGTMTAVGATITGGIFQVKDGNTTKFKIDSDGKIYMSSGWYIDPYDFCGPYSFSTNTVNHSSRGFVDINCNANNNPRISVGIDAGNYSSPFRVYSNGALYFNNKGPAIIITSLTTSSITGWDKDGNTVTANFFNSGLLGVGRDGAKIFPTYNGTNYEDAGYEVTLSRGSWSDGQQTVTAKFNDNVLTTIQCSVPTRDTGDSTQWLHSGNTWYTRIKLGGAWRTSATRDFGPDLQAQYDLGHDNGYDEGYEDGYDRGWNDCIDSCSYSRDTHYIAVTVPGAGIIYTSIGTGWCIPPAKKE